jgi:hypothetical protein
MEDVETRVEVVLNSGVTEKFWYTHMVEDSGFLKFFTKKGTEYLFQKDCVMMMVVYHTRDN